jgi:hypothetical protein
MHLLRKSMFLQRLKCLLQRSYVPPAIPIQLLFSAPASTPTPFLCSPAFTPTPFLCSPACGGGGDGRDGGENQMELVVVVEIVRSCRRRWW